MKNKSILNNLINHLPQLISWKDRNGIFRGCNLAFAKQFGFKDTQEIIGKSEYDFDWPAERRYQHIIEDHEVMCNDQSKVNLEEEHPQLDGSIKTMLITKVPLHDHEGAVTGVLRTWLDISDIKAQRNQYKMAEDNLNQMRVLASTISHDIRNPLNTISLINDLNKNNLMTLLNVYQRANEAGLVEHPIDPKQLNMIKTMPNQFDHCIKLANSIINMTLANLKGASNKEAWKIMPISEILGDYYTHYPFVRGQSDWVHINGNVDFNVKGDPAALVNIFNNLTANAIYFIKEAGKGQIYITCRQGDDFNHVYFKDTAKGCDKSEFNKIFEGFYSTRSGGIGLGLASCKRIIKELGGDIDLKSQVGEYMEFRLSLPKVA